MADVAKQLKNLRSSISRGIVGQKDLIDGLITAVLANGHVLIEGVPGLAKTRAVRLLAASCEAEMARLQFTPDLLPADIVGTQLYDQGSGDFRIRKGPIFANFILADEINRAAPKVQSALLEAMQERQVTIAEASLPLPEPFCVFATQNPVEQEGTYPLPEAQLDRFLMKLVVDYPERSEERQIVRMVMNEVELPAIEAVIDSAGLLALQQAQREVYVEDRLIDYAAELVLATRDPAKAGLEELEGVVELGASPRATLAMVQVGRARALLDGRDHTIPEDIKASAYDVLRHRLILGYHAQAEGIRPESVIEKILGAVAVP